MKVDTINLAKSRSSFSYWKFLMFYNSIIQLICILCESVNIEKRKFYRCIAIIRIRSHNILTKAEYHADLASVLMGILYRHNGNIVSINMLRCLWWYANVQKNHSHRNNDRKFFANAKIRIYENHEYRLSALLRVKYQFHGFTPFDFLLLTQSVWGWFY